MQSKPNNLLSCDAKNECPLGRPDARSEGYQAHFEQEAATWLAVEFRLEPRLCFRG